MRLNYSAEFFSPSRVWRGAGSICLLGLLIIASTEEAYAQGRLILNNNGRVVINNGAWLVIDNPAPNGITTIGTGGLIQSENENDRIRWKVGNTSAGNTYVLPYASNLGTKIPFTCSVTGSGTGTATSSIVFSTYNHTIGAGTWNNDLYRPSDVTHMNNWNTGIVTTPGATNESAHVVDRFWIIDVNVAPYAFTGNPSLTLGFTYSPTEDIQGGNLIAGLPLGAQRFNSGTSQWGDFAPGIGTWAVGSVSNVVVPASQLFRSWTLSDIENPLPIELLRFDVQCLNNSVTIHWATASEQDNELFTIERSNDGENFVAIGHVAGAGTSLGVIEYQFIDQTPEANGYYRLRQTDLDGSEVISDVRVAPCSNIGETTIVNSWDDGMNLNVLVSMNGAQEQNVHLFDASGKVVWESLSVGFADGISTLQIPKGSLVNGIYVVRFDRNGSMMSRRLPLVR